MSCNTLLRSHGYNLPYDEEFEGDSSRMEMDEVHVAGDCKTKEMHRAAQQHPILLFTTQAYLFVLDLAFFLSLILPPFRGFLSLNFNAARTQRRMARRGRRRRRQVLASREFGVLLDHRPVATYDPLSPHLVRNSARGRAVSHYLRRLTHTAPKWKKHVAQLQSFGMLKKVPLNSLHFCASYFAVPKSNGKARAIFNGRRLSSMMKSPPPVNLPELVDMLEMIASDSSTPMGIWTTGIRHWFHQIPVHERISLFFGIVLKGAAFRWSTLPMGIASAQCLAWTMIVHYASEEGERWPFVLHPDEALAQPPQFLELKRGGFVSVFYDNIIVVGTDEDVRLLKNRIQGNAREFGVTFKAEEDQFLTAKEWNEMKNSGVQYLGVEIRRTRVQHSASFLRRQKKKGIPLDERATRHFVTSWRQIPEKAKKWEASFDLLRSVGDEHIEEESVTTSFRHVAGCVGRIIWHHSLTRVPLCDIHHIVGILRRIAKLRGSSHAHWDAPVTLLPQEVGDLLAYSDIIQQNNWLSLQGKPFHPSEAVYACSDSSDNQWGFVIFDDLTTTSAQSYSAAVGGEVDIVMIVAKTPQTLFQRVASSAERLVGLASEDLCCVGQFLLRTLLAP